jgi:hypothetical protein
MVCAHCGKNSGKNYLCQKCLKSYDIARWQDNSLRAAYGTKDFDRQAKRLQTLYKKKK